MSLCNRYYIIYDEYSITICTHLDDVCDAIALGATIYGYTDDENMAHALMNECFNMIDNNNS